MAAGRDWPDGVSGEGTLFHQKAPRRFLRVRGPRCPLSGPWNWPTLEGSVLSRGHVNGKLCRTQRMHLYWALPWDLSRQICFLHTLGPFLGRTIWRGSVRAGVCAGTPHYFHLMEEKGKTPNIQRTPALPRCWADVLSRL